MTYDLKSEKTIAKMVALRENSVDVQEYVALEKQLSKDKKEDSPMLVGLRSEGIIAENTKFTEGFVSVYFREIEQIDKNDDGLAKVTNAQVLAIARMYPELIKAILTPDVIDTAIKGAVGKRTEDAQTIQKINRQNCIKTVYQAVIGEAKN